jgi:hypothetical protein
MVWCCGCLGEGLLVRGSLEEGLFGGLGSWGGWLGRVWRGGLRYERRERGDGSWEKWLRKEWFGRSGCGMAAGMEGLVVSKGAGERCCGVKWKYV